MAEPTSHKLGSMWRRTRSGIGSAARAGDAVERKRHREHGRVVLNVDSCDRDVRILDVRPAHVAELGHQVARSIKLGSTTRSDGLPRREIFELGGVEFLPLGVCGWDTWWFCVALLDRWWFCAVLRRRTAETANAPAAVRVAAPAAAAPAAAPAARGWPRPRKREGLVPPAEPAPPTRGATGGPCVPDSDERPLPPPPLPLSWPPPRSPARALAVPPRSVATCAGTLNFLWLLAEPSSSTPRLLDVDATAAWGRRAVAFWAASTSS